MELPIVPLSLALAYLLGAATSPFLRFVDKQSDNLIQRHLEKLLRNFVHYRGEGALPLKVLLELAHQGRTMPARTLEITTYGRGARGLLSPQLTFCGDYKLIQKEPGHYSNWFVVFCHDDEKEKYYRDCAEYVVHRDPFELRGERPDRLPTCS